ncbi:phosphoribosylanthranilate isomerase [Cytophaga aurantiaca]|uniref:phosphoribosylanthranilate isomerase n=1 Tax=Cytophaga aurantiaca TaxID=29530 RepID=UPI00039DD5C3|nr:phosphoribosylanthranilate isomerase [Cytophaga aurantiaca]
MKLKVCGMKYPDNAGAVATLAPDYMGFIFYKPSKRYCGETLTPEFVKALPASIIKTGVFVNESLEEVLRICSAYGFKAVQLHGHETPEFCLACKKDGLEVIKVFHVGEIMDWSILEPYKKVADYFLFDTKTPEYGGSGNRFNWEILKEYDNKIPLFLSGGIDESILSELNTLSSVNIYALDINSRFELEPGLKDVERVRKFAQSLKPKA